MHVTEKLTRPLTEAKYLNADNVDRYRSIMRIFFENYEKLKYWLYQEEIYAEMVKEPHFNDYRIEQCQQDLNTLTEWKNLSAIQDTKKVASLEEFKNKKYRYQMSAMIFGIERPVHLKSKAPHQTDSMNAGIYEEPVVKIVLKPRTRFYPEKSRRRGATRKIYGRCICRGEKG